jgi:F-type H+-transporting ATPase subunit b
MEDFLKLIPRLVEDGLAIDTGQILIQLLATLILFIVVFRFLWKPITTLLEERREIISTDLEDAKKVNEDAYKIKEELEEKLLEAKTEAKFIIEASRERGENEKVRILDDAEKEAIARLKKAEDEILREVSVARQNLKQEIVDVAFEVAEKIVEKEVDSSVHAKTVEDVLEGRYNAK